MQHPYALDTNTFIRRARGRHGLRYNYSRVRYTAAHDPVEIICAEHGVFSQKAYSHLNGKGCAECSGTKKHTFESFTAAASTLHRGRYDYSESEYKNNKTKIAIKCREHGVFFQTPNSHLFGRGCPQCAKSGYKTTGDGYVYLLLSECGRFFKVGISNKPRQRFSELRVATPFMFVVLEVFKMRADLAPSVEKWAHQNGRPAGLSGFGGATEWLEADLDFEYLLHCIGQQLRAA